MPKLDSPTVEGQWIDLREQRPSDCARILVCDENGYVQIEDTGSAREYEQLGYPVPDLFGGRIPTFEEMWESGNQTRLVAWMPLPHWTEKLCNPDANGECP